MGRNRLVRTHDARRIRLRTSADLSAVTSAELAFSYLDPLTSGLLLGITIAAMFLGHWYLNTPTMRTVPRCSGW